MKNNKVSLDEGKVGRIHKFMKAKSDQNNFLVLFYLSILFKLPILRKYLMSYIELCFPMASDSKNFLYLDLVSLVKILSSSGLNIDSELQIFNAADSWLCHDIIERGKYAKYLLSKVRLSLLSVPALNKLLTKVSSFSVDDDCTNIIKEALLHNKDLISSTYNIASRYCNKSSLNITLCGGHNVYKDAAVADVKSFDVNNLGKVTRLPKMRNARSEFKAHCVKGELYVFGGVDEHRVDEDAVGTVEKYSLANDRWEILCQMCDNRVMFSTCSFMDSVYVVGGQLKATCAEFSTKKAEWRKVSSMSGERLKAACSVFKGRIVASGGLSYDIVHTSTGLNTVIAYDHVANAWSKMANMIKGRCDHSSVAVNDKLFIVGGYMLNSLEVFDSRSNKFSLLKEPFSGITRNYEFTPEETFTVDSKLLIVCDKGRVIFYDYMNDEYSEKKCRATKDLIDFSCVNLPVIAFEKKTVTTQ